MNKRLSEAVERIKMLPEERQQRAAALLLDFLEENDLTVELTAAQKAEVEEALSDNEPFASEEEVRIFFERLLK